MIQTTNQVGAAVRYVEIFYLAVSMNVKEAVMKGYVAVVML